MLRVKRLQWNFRGNQMIFVNNLLADLMWDVHDWFFNPESGYAVFIVQDMKWVGWTVGFGWRRSWGQKHQERVEFSLLIYACKIQ
jgi:hypothetical protein